MADNYGTPAGFRAYHTARGRDLPIEANDDTAVLEWLLNASEWMDGVYTVTNLPVGGRDQLRTWPVISFYDRNDYLVTGVPREVENGTYEAALLVGKGVELIKEWTPNKYDSVSIDGAVSVKYSKFMSAADVQTQYLGIDRIMARLLGGSGGAANPFCGSRVRV